jgi:cation:H+ antiporter
VCPAPADGREVLSVILDILLFLGGLVVLVAGGHALVTGASALARRLGLSSLVIGLTVVAWGTGAPELAVSLGAALRGQGDMALGNVVGSNIINILGVLGAAALVAPLVVSRRLVWHDVPILVGLSAAVLALGFDGRIGWLEGGLLFLAGVAYTVHAMRASRRVGVANSADRPRSAVGLTRAGLLAAVGMALLVLGARWMVEAATSFARALGVSDLVVGLTVVALGTSLPEVAASVVAALRGQRDIAVGNAIGSNIFNIAYVLGLTAILAPGGVPVPEPALRFDLPVMIAVAAACLPIFFTGHRIARWEGVLFLAYYAAYLLFLVLQAEQHAVLPAFSRAMLGFVIPLTVATLGVVAWREVRRSARS